MSVYIRHRYTKNQYNHIKANIIVSEYELNVYIEECGILVIYIYIIHTYKLIYDNHSTLRNLGIKRSVN